MSPERRTLLVEALIAIYEQFPDQAMGSTNPIRGYVESLTDTELSVKIANIEALLERAQQTDV